MWVHTGRLPHVLATRCYHDPEHHARELAVLFAGGWHCVATRGALRDPGDFVTVELLGEPVLVRNCDGELRAFQNVCAHRHAQLTSVSRGRSPRIRCQYHGWEYDADGRSLRVPDARSFVPIRRGGECLRRYRAASCGQLVFVSLAPGDGARAGGAVSEALAPGDGARAGGAVSEARAPGDGARAGGAVSEARAPGDGARAGGAVSEARADDQPALRGALGERTWAMIEDIFSDDYGEVAAWTVEHAANWKVPVENALESYHVPQIHKRTFRTLSDARDSTHTFDPRFTALESVEPPKGVGLRWISERWRDRPRHVYAHHHAFPNLLLAHTDISSLAHVVLPTSPTSSRSLAFCFVHRGDGRRLLHRALGPIVDRMVEHYTRTVLREDNMVFAAIQRGLRASGHAGVLGAREERIHAFQEYVMRELGERP